MVPKPAAESILRGWSEHVELRNYNASALEAMMLKVEWRPKFIAAFASVGVGELTVGLMIHKMEERKSVIAAPIVAPIVGPIVAHPQGHAGAVAGPGPGSTGTGDRHSPRRLLCSALPRTPTAQDALMWTTPTTNHSSYNYWEPASVRPWDFADPADKASGGLAAAIIEHQEAADITYNEAPRQALSTRVTLPQSYGSPVTTRTRRLREVFPTCRDMPGSGAAASSSSPGVSFRADLMLTVDDEQQQPQQQQRKRPAAGEGGGEGEEEAPDDLRASKRRCVFVGEVKTVQRLMEQVDKPMDLRGAWSDASHRQQHAQARAVISQLYTYMQVWRICYGFISCWYGTWMAYCPPAAAQRGILYLSDAFLASTQHPAPDGTPAATMLGAVAWGQYLALSSANRLADVLPPSMGAAAAGGAAGGSDGGQDAHGDDSQGPRDAGALPGSGDEYPSPRSSVDRASSGSYGERHRQQHGAPGKESTSAAAPLSASLQLSGQLSTGSEGAVLHGVCRGMAAVVKLLGPDNRGLAAYGREVQAYRALEPLQGKAVPVLLAAGHLAAGVHFLATGLVQGTPLSSLVPVPDAVARAAMRALERVHGTSPGFLHGDIRLQNILLAAGADEDTPTCVVLDFGRSRLGGNTQQQEFERAQLRALPGVSLKADLMLTVDDEQQQPQQQQRKRPAAGEGGGEGEEEAPDDLRAHKRRCVLVGEIKTVQRLMEQVDKPMDLRGAWSDASHRQHHAQARAVISQLYTYMQVWRICYGFISCWYGTWLAYCPPAAAEHGILYLSNAFLASTQHPALDGAPAATMLGAVAWVQYLALSSANRLADLSGQLSTGSEGAVLHGLCRGMAAVVKLLGPDDHGLAAYGREVQAYRALEPLQGKAVPVLLAAGHLAAGVHFLATGLVQGSPLSSLVPVPDAVARAAMRALERVHGTSPGFLHGDIRLQNMLLAAGTGEDTPTCVVLDFGRSRLGGNTQQQEHERAQLRALLGAGAGPGPGSAGAGGEFQY
ncbi:hypothetical protein TSOC_008675 [Tetrabaena socialis]|uniref:Protein kinase domain-containing protein n=1 Tax=Tetrabaena socialis TaxID=47790 RepID=A0A2J7ZXU5_9CHLO|nr:hypothetical protein TSOC_008675 [Tetrabaena socialis]|eukprot:PNH05089.1 hypothetical protein TSOC_008675 [Tetrabaena socialis]